jgi:hypothetical protein
MNTTSARFGTQDVDLCHLPIPMPFVNNAFYSTPFANKVGYFPQKGKWGL